MQDMYNDIPNVIPQMRSKKSTVYVNLTLTFEVERLFSVDLRLRRRKIKKEKKNESEEIMAKPIKSMIKYY